MGEIDDTDIRLLEIEVWRAPYFHTNSTARMTALPAFKRINASNDTHVVDLVEIVLAGDAPSPLHDGKADL